MNNCVRIIPRKVPGILFNMSNLRYSSSLGEPGSGAGKGGGGGGSIREAGGSFGKREAAQEEEYFYRQQKEQIAKLKGSLNDEITFHEEQIQRHKEAIERNKKRVEELGKEKYMSGMKPKNTDVRWDPMTALKKSRSQKERKRRHDERIKKILGTE